MLVLFVLSSLFLLRTKALTWLRWLPVLLLAQALTLLALGTGSRELLGMVFTGLIFHGFVWLKVLPQLWKKHNLTLISQLRSRRG